MTVTSKGIDASDSPPEFMAVTLTQYTPGGMLLRVNVRFVVVAGATEGVPPNSTLAGVAPQRTVYKLTGALETGLPSTSWVGASHVATI